MNVSQTALLAAGLLALGLAGGGTPEPASAPLVGGPVALPLPASDGVHGDPADAPAPALDDLVEQYCVRCHNERRLRGDLSLEGFDVAAPETDARIAERMIHKLRAGMMPPAGVRRPPEDSLALLAATLENRLDEVARHDPDPGRRSFQRLNRAEYEASIEQLFGIRIDASAFLPTETLSDNFDNIADMQMLSATVMEGYLRAAAHVARAMRSGTCPGFAGVLGVQGSEEPSRRWATWKANAARHARGGTSVHAQLPGGR